MESILTSIKKLLGIAEEHEQFDVDIMMHINSVLVILNQLSVGPPEGFLLEDKDTTWDEFVFDQTNIEFIKSYVYLKVRLLFDPPSSAAAIESMTKLTNELEWRINVAAESNRIEREEEMKNAGFDFNHQHIWPFWRT